MLNSRIFHVVLIIITPIIYIRSRYLAFFNSKIIWGCDGTFHYVTNKIYSETIFPKLFGWINNWYTGMPWPLGYTPLYPYFLAVLDHILPFEYFTIFKTLNFVLLLSIPVLIYIIGIRLNYPKKFSLIISLLTLFWFFLIDVIRIPAVVSINGSTLTIGLYSQLFGTVIFLIWFYFFLKFENLDYNFFFSTLLLALMILTKGLVKIREDFDSTLSSILYKYYHFCG